MRSDGLSFPSRSATRSGSRLIPIGRTARLVDEEGVLVATGDTAIDDELVFGLIDTGRR
jgi:hypothetical protein